MENYSSGIVIFGGTAEGRRLSEKLSEMGASVKVCVATEYGWQEQNRVKGIRILTGRQKVDQMRKTLKGCRLCIDATHPYAEEASKNIKMACEAEGIQLLRLLRPKSAYPANCIFADSAEEAAEWLQETEGKIFLTTGAKELSAYKSLGGERLIPRVLPLVSSLESCRNAGVPGHNIIAMQGPFSQEVNEALMRQFEVRYMVTKDGGRAGGFAEKMQAAENCGVQVIVIKRPEETGFPEEEILTKAQKILKETTGSDKKAGKTGST